MNDFGFAMAWLSLQVALVLVPALILQAVASKRGPAPAAWVASWSLGLVILLGFSAIVASPLPRSSVPSIPVSSSAAMIKGSSEAGTSESSGGVLLEGQPDPRSRRTLSLETLRNAWNHFERRAAEPAARFRVWGRFVAVIALAGSGFGLIRLLLGLWAVGHCRRLGRLVEDSNVNGLSPYHRGPRNLRPRHAGHGGLAKADDPASRRLASLGRIGTSSRDRARTGSYHSRRLRGGTGGQAGPGDPLLSPIGAVDGRTLDAPARTGG
jgi:hypothetical protein